MKIIKTVKMTEETHTTGDTANPTAAKRTVGEMADDSQLEMPEPKKPRSSPDLSDVETLDSEGDVVLAIKKSDSETQDKFLVSSRVLSLASPVFRKMFSPSFSEGHQVRNGDVPCIRLEEGDAEAMRTILRIFHHHHDDVPFSLAPTKMAAIAIHCDKYDCRKALEVWIRHWCGAKISSNFGVSTPDTIGLTLVAAYMFRRSALFLSNAASKASKFLRLDFKAVWDQEEMMTLLPDMFASSLLVHIDETLGRLRSTIDSVDQMLQQRSKGYKIPGQRICPPCDFVFTNGEKKCSCGNFLTDRCCTVEFRVAEYFALLRRYGLYPAEEPFSTLSVDEVYQNIYNMATGHGHECAGGYNCPLKVALRKVSDDSLAIRTAVDFVWTWS